MRKRICISWSLDDVFDRDCLISEIKMDDIFRFNYKEFHLIAASRNWETDTLRLYLYHPEFLVVPQGESCPHYYYNEAKRIFPYLFSEETNPILYRKFK